MRRRNWLLVLTALLVLVVAALLLGGSLGLLGGDGDTDSAQISERVDQRVESIDTVRFTLEQTVETDNRTLSFRARVVYQRPDRINITYFDGPVPYTRVVSNGSVTWLYNESSNEIQIADEPAYDRPSKLLIGVDQLGGNATFEGNETLAGEDATELSFAVDDSEVSLLLAGGQETSQLGEATTNGTVETSVWIDTDLWLPRKATVSVPAFEDNRTITVRYDEYEIDPNVSDEQFTFEAPDDAAVVRGDQSNFRPPLENSTFYDDRTAVAANASVALPEPTLPAGYAFVEGAVIDARIGEGVELTYHDGDARLEVVTLREYRRFFDQGETVTVDGADGLYVALPNGRFVQWACNDRLYLVSGPEDRETLLSIAESIGCS